MIITINLQDWFIHYLNHKTITVCLKETTEASSAE